MSESPEHLFLKETALQVLNDFSSLDLYTYEEAERSRFDLACLLTRDWTRPLVGQVLWRNVPGLDKDMRTLFTDKESQIKLYVAQDGIRTRQLFAEAVDDYRRSGKHDDLFKLKSVWIPADFDADSDNDRAVVAELIRGSVVRDILFNVLFGNLSARHVSFFLNASGVPGLNFALLITILSGDPHNYTSMAQALGISSGPIREKLHILAGAGFIETPMGALLYKVTNRGRVFIDLVRRILREIQEPSLTPELQYILDLLQLQRVPLADVLDNREVFPKNSYIHLLRTALAADGRWGVFSDFERITYKRD